MNKVSNKIKRLVSSVYKRGIYNSFVYIFIYRKNLKRAEQEASNENWGKAAKCYQKATQIRAGTIPSSTWARYSRACRELQRWDQAEKIVTAAMKSNPKDGDLLIEFAEIAMGKQDWAEASARWVEASEYNKNNIAVLVRLSRTHRYTLDTELAKHFIENAIKNNPESLELNIEMAEILMLEKEWKKASEKWQVVAKLSNEMKSEEYTNINAWLKTIQSQENLGQYQEAEVTARKGINKHPSSTKLINEYAKLAVKKNDLPKALERWKGITSRLGSSTSIEEFAGAYEARFNASIIKRTLGIDDYKIQIEEYKKRKLKPKIAVYTAISNNYDSLKLPENLNPKYEYIVYTDAPMPNVGIYDIRPMPFMHEDATRSARFVKTHPHTLLSEYDVAIWIDANIMITGDFHKHIEDFLNSDKAFAAIPHPIRDTVYEEFESCVEKSKDEKNIMAEQVNKYRNEGFDGKGLIESNFMAFDLKSSGIDDFLNLWWSEIDKHSKRDQLSLPYAAKRTETKWHPFTQKPNSIRNHPSFVLTPHGFDDHLLSALYDQLGAQTHDPFRDTSYSTVKSKRIAKQSKRSIDIVVCVHNALEEVGLCLESIQKNRMSDNQKLIIVDDGSDGPTKKYLEGFTKTQEWITLLRNERAGGYTRAANKGLEASDADLSILLNSDTVTTEGWAEKMADAVFSTPGAGIVGPLSSAASHQSIPDHMSTKDQTAVNELPEGISVENMNHYCEGWSLANYVPIVPLVHGFCFGITQEAIDKIGYFDEKNFPKGYGEENDYCFRAINNGIGLVIATHTYIFHAKSKSYVGPKRIELMKSGNEKIKELHSKERISRAIRTMQGNPILQNIREEANSLYSKN